MTKFWWKDEPIIVGSLRYKIIDNDFKNTIHECVKMLKSDTTVSEAVEMCMNAGIHISFHLEPKLKVKQGGKI